MWPCSDWICLYICNCKKLSNMLYRSDYHIVWTLRYCFKDLEGGEDAIGT